MSACDCVMVIV